MIANYFWNVCLCEALYPALNAIEITLRNSIHSNLSRRYDDDHWFDRPNLLEDRQRKQVEEAYQRLRLRHRPENAGRIVAELHFGFWSSLLNRPYEGSFWAPNGYELLRRTFPDASRRLQKPTLFRSRVYEINTFRNRVFHYEPIWKLADLARIHEQILEAIGWLSSAMRNWVTHFDRFHEVYQQRRATYERQVLSVLPQQTDR